MELVSARTTTSPAERDDALEKEKRSRPDVAYEAIRAGIADGRYPPGARLVIEQLARDLDMSTVPIREAIRRLEAGGYVTFRRNQGATVASVDAEAYGQSMQTLAVLEGAATSLARLDATQLREARRINASLRESLREFDPLKFTAGNHDLHRVLYSACPNRHLVALIEREWERLTAIRRSTFAFVPNRAAQAVEEHAQLLDLLAAGAAPEEVERFAREHRMRTARRFLERVPGDAS